MRKNVTVCPFEQAQQEGWAPGGVVFDWAWRVELAHNNTIVGSCNGKYKQAKEKANTVAKKTANQQKPRHGIIINTHTHDARPFSSAIKK
jgi:hypothetical protein